MPAQTLSRIFAAALAPALLLGVWSNAVAVDQTLEQANALRNEDPQAALALLDRRLDQAPADVSPAEEAPLLSLRTQINRDLGRLADAVEDAERYQRLAEAMDDPLMTARALYLRGTIQAERNDAAGALERFHEARRLFEAAGATAELARVNNAIGAGHNFLGNHRHARQYFEQALALARASNPAMETSALGNLALVVAELEGPEAGLALHREALELAEQRGETGVIIYQLANICDRTVETGRLNEAETACRRAIERVEMLGHVRVLAGTRMSLGDLYYEQGQLEAARSQYEQALALARGQISSVEQPVLEKLAVLHEARGEPAQALDYYRQLTGLREAALARERDSLVEELEVRYRVEQREREIDYLQLDAELQATRLRQRNVMLGAALGALLLCAVLALLAWRGYHLKSTLQQQLATRNRELQQAVETIGELARTDSLTGLLNRGAFLAVAREEQARCRVTGKPLAVAIADLDHFKQLNDRHGHPVGDQVLVKVAARLQEAMRKRDYLCRWGGEEFVFLLPETDRQAACRVAGRISRHLAKTPITTDAGIFPVTLTFGIALVGDDLEAAIQHADEAMYEGKRAGRGGVVSNAHGEVV